MTSIGPFSKDRIALCSADAGPRSQKKIPDQAGYFFPKAKWVGATRNKAEKLGCRFVILTTGRGMVNPWDTISLFDRHIDEYPKEISEKWEETIPNILGTNQYDILIFYAGGCPRDAYIELMIPILKTINVSLITFGRPNMFDINALEDCVEGLIKGTTFQKLKAFLKCPERLEFYTAGEKYILHRRPIKKSLEDFNSNHEKIQVLFDKLGNPYDPAFIGKTILDFGKSYNRTVTEIIRKTTDRLSKEVFYECVGKLMPNFQMTRSGPFKGIKYSNGRVKDPDGQIEKCWVEIGDDVVNLRNYIDRFHKKERGRVILGMSNEAQNEIVKRLSAIFNKLLPVCMGKSTSGRVGASKVLFAVLPEVSLPVDTTQWKKVFKTIDYGEIISQMIIEIINWESASGCQLNSCSPYDDFTLPATYNVLAMKARPKSV